MAHIELDERLRPHYFTIKSKKVIKGYQEGKHLLPMVKQLLGYDSRIRWHDRSNAGTIVIGDNKSHRAFRGVTPGFPDIFGIFEAGWFFGLELKSPGQLPTLKQQDVLIHLLNSDGLIGIIDHDTLLPSLLDHWSSCVSDRLRLFDKSDHP